MPDWGSRLCNYYWHLRYNRTYNEAARRRYYRKIAAEKKRLIESGVDCEAVRLFCRMMANPANNAAVLRFENYTRQGRLF